MANKSTNQKPNRLILIKKYAFAAINLYGVIKLEDFIFVFNHYEKDIPQVQLQHHLQYLPEQSNRLPSLLQDGH